MHARAREKPTIVYRNHKSKNILTMIENSHALSIVIRAIILQCPYKLTEQTRIDERQQSRDKTRVSIFFTQKKHSYKAYICHKRVFHIELLRR